MNYILGTASHALGIGQFKLKRLGLHFLMNHVIVTY